MALAAAVVAGLRRYVSYERVCLHEGTSTYWVALVWAFAGLVGGITAFAQSAFQALAFRGEGKSISESGCAAEW